MSIVETILSQTIVGNRLQERLKQHVEKMKIIQ